MQKVLFFLFITLITYSCAKEESLPVKADFSIKVVNNDYSVPVKVEITNMSVGADTYQWSFEGATVNTSNEKSPKPIIYTKKGTYKIRLKASNKDGNEDVKEIEIPIDAAMKVAFNWKLLGSDISPVTIEMQNQSLGAKEYFWKFENGNPTTSTDKNPTVIFNSEGKHNINLTISNGKETYSKDTIITVKPAMTIDFNWSVDYIDSDYQAPVVLHLNNMSNNAFSYKWVIKGATPSISTEKNPDIQFTKSGTYIINLYATNDKETKTLKKKITIHPNNNLLSFSNIKLGINTAKNTIGCFFSSKLGAVIKETEITNENGNKIDFGFFGLNSKFNYNQFLSPDEVQSTSFNVIEKAIHTKIINSQELVGVQLSPSQFDAINLGNAFNSIDIEETNKGKTPFNSDQRPRVILFKTEDNRKGAIKINDFLSEGVNSYILVDIKVQKQSE